MNETETLLKQILLRLKRVETRLMALMIHQGMQNDGENKIVDRAENVYTTGQGEMK